MQQNDLLPRRTLRRQLNPVRYCLAVVASCASLLAGAHAHSQSTDETTPDATPPLPNGAELERRGATIGRITFARDNVFDLSQPGEDYRLYGLANRLHVMTKEGVIRSQLLVKPGDRYDERLIEESARILRRNRYLFDASIKVSGYSDGVVDLTVWTRDVWTLVPDVSFSRTGGEDKWRVGIVENNLLGWGTRVKLTYEENVDRDITIFEVSDQNVLRSRTELLLQLADSSDGGTERLAIRRPFFALDTRWSAGFDIGSSDFEERFYDLGNEAAEYRQESNSYSAFGGLSSGLRSGWVKRWTAGVALDEDRFTPALDPEFPVLLPADRRLVYPFIGFEMIEDDFRTAANRDQFERTEDFLLGTRFAATLGYASEALDSDRDSLLYWASFSRGFGKLDKNAWLVRTDVSGRVDDGRSANTLLRLNLRYYSQRTKKRLFFMSLDGAWGDELDLDNLQLLGGSSGLRGYPLRYQSGQSRALISIEERYFTDWYPFRLFRVGFAAFADAGRTWGRNALGNESRGWLTDVGFGLRLAPTRAGTREIFHIDLAFPLDGDDSIDSAQLILEAKGSF
ncbi:MAG: POTRA domain-containing protein [Pseudomonadota bacterium]